MRTPTCSSCRQQCHCLPPLLSILLLFHRCRSWKRVSLITLLEHTVSCLHYAPLMYSSSSNTSRLRRGFFVTSSPPLISVAAVGGGTIDVAERMRLKGVVFDMDGTLVFDMDGTLTVLVIDFPAMYRAVLGSDWYAELGCDSVDILHHIETWMLPEQQVYEIIAGLSGRGSIGSRSCPVSPRIFRS